MCNVVVIVQIWCKFGASAGAGAVRWVQRCVYLPIRVTPMMLMLAFVVLDLIADMFAVFFFFSRNCWMTQTLNYLAKQV